MKKFEDLFFFLPLLGNTLIFKGGGSRSTLLNLSAEPFFGRRWGPSSSSPPMKAPAPSGLFHETSFFRVCRFSLLRPLFLSPGSFPFEDPPLKWLQVPSPPPERRIRLFRGFGTLPSQYSPPPFPDLRGTPHNVTKRLPPPSTFKSSLWTAFQVSFSLWWRAFPRRELLFKENFFLRDWLSLS